VVYFAADETLILVKLVAPRELVVALIIMTLLYSALNKLERYHHHHCSIVKG